MPSICKSENIILELQQRTEIQIPDIQKPETLKNRTFLISGFQMVDILAQKKRKRKLNAKRSRLVQTIPKPDHSKIGPRLTIQKMDTSGFRIPTVFHWAIKCKIVFNPWKSLLFYSYKLNYFFLTFILSQISYYFLIFLNFFFSSFFFFPAWQHNIQQTCQ